MTGSDERLCAFVWGDTGAHRCHLIDGHTTEHRCTCDATTAGNWTREDQAQADADRIRQEDIELHLGGGPDLYDHSTDPTP